MPGCPSILRYPRRARRSCRSSRTTATPSERTNGAENTRAGAAASMCEKRQLASMQARVRRPARTRATASPARSRMRRSLPCRIVSACFPVGSIGLLRGHRLERGSTRVPCRAGRGMIPRPSAVFGMNERQSGVGGSLASPGRAVAIVLVASFSLAGPLRADQVTEARDLVRAMASVGGVAGREGQVRAAIRRASPSWASFQEDNLGNLTVSVGSGKPALLLVAHMDEPGYLVTGVTDRGYLTLQRLARLPLPPLFDQFHMGQPLLVQGRRGAVQAVSVVYSTHLWRGSGVPIDRPVRDEDLLVDVGARSAAEAEAAGVALLDSVVIARRIVDLAGGKLAGPAMDDRAGCAALVLLLNRIEPAKIRGTLTIAFSAQQLMNGRGAARLANRIEADDVLVVDAPSPGAPSTAPGIGPAVAVPARH